MAEITMDQKLSKIQNLMARALGTKFEAEANTCFLKAQELMVKWNIDSSQIEGPKEEEEIIRCEMWEAGSMKVEWKTLLAKVLAKNFRCKMFVTQDGVANKSLRYVVFLGTRTDVQIVRELYLKALKIVKKGQQRMMDKLAWRGESIKGISGDYAEGFVAGLHEAFKHQVDEQGWGLVISTPKEVQAAWDKMSFNQDWHSNKTVTRGCSEAFEAGRLDGKNLIPSQKRQFIEGGEN